MKRLLCTIALIVVMLFSFTGCGAPWLNLSEWQKIMDENTFIVGVNKTLIVDELTPEDFSPIDVTKIIPIDGVFSKAEHFETVIFYAVKTSNPYDYENTINRLCDLNFVEIAWRNKYDYYQHPMPLEEKDPLKIKEHWEGFSGYIFVTIDSSYRDRIFTQKDFNLKNIVSVEWLVNFNYLSAPSDFLQYYLEISNKTDAALNDTLQALYKLDFVRCVGPATDGKD